MDLTKVLKSEEPRICEICNADFAKYTCPRCGLPYCSIDCYKDVKKHLKCSESFYRDCIADEIKLNEKDVAAAACSSGSGNGGEDSSSQKMKEILVRFHEAQENNGGISADLDNRDEEEDEDTESSSESESSLDSDDEESLKKRMEGVNLDDANTVWSKLTLEEKKGFQKFVQEYNEKYKNVDFGDDEKD